MGGLVSTTSRVVLCYKKARTFWGPRAFATTGARITVSGGLASNTEIALSISVCIILMVGVIYAHAHILGFKHTNLVCSKPFILFIFHIGFLSNWTVIL